MTISNSWAVFQSALKLHKISKWKLAKDLKISYRTIQYWEKGHSKPSKENQEKLADYFGMARPNSIEERLEAIETRLGKLEDCIIKKGEEE